MTDVARYERNEEREGRKYEGIPLNWYIARHLDVATVIQTNILF